jgi:ABC-type antimicrobial peptide transport system permease subunit
VFVELFDHESDKRALKAREEYKISRAQSSETTVENEPRPSEDGQSLLQTIIMVIGGLILVILLVLFARWLYHKVHHSDQNTVSINQPAQPYSSPSNQPAVTPPSPNQPGNPANTNSGLPNSGPGNVIAIFAASTLATAGLHYIISLRRFSSQS